MLGEEVTIESNRDGGERFSLRLTRVGRRGDIRNISALPDSGTAVRVSLKNSVVDSIRPLGELVRVYAPMPPIRWK